MKICTITCHDVYNSGASLQAYALQKYISDLGHDVKIIDYKPEYLRNYWIWGNVSERFDKPIIREAYCIAKMPKRLRAYFSKRKRNFDLFRDQYLYITEERFYDNESLKRNAPQADIYFAGSDQIWNTLFNNGRDPAFYLDFAPNSAVKASYAASFATQDIAPELREFVKSSLQKLDWISVRESTGLEILQSLGCTGVQVLDPVFLLDAAVWGKMVTRKSSEPYIFVYAFEGGRDICEFAQKLAEKTNMKIYTLQKLSFGDRCFPDAGPLEFLNLVYNAEYVLSNSFHATAFSIIFHKQFWVFNRSEGINTRMHDLTQALGLSNRMVQNTECNTTERIDYKNADIVLKNAISESKGYIEKVIASGK